LATLRMLSRDDRPTVPAADFPVIEISEVVISSNALTDSR
jgi:hypothetical protein